MRSPPWFCTVSRGAPTPDSRQISGQRPLAKRRTRDPLEGTSGLRGALCQLDAPIRTHAHASTHLRKSCSPQSCHLYGPALTRMRWPPADSFCNARTCADATSRTSIQLKLIQTDVRSARLLSGRHTLERQDSSRDSCRHQGRHHASGPRRVLTVAGSESVQRPKAG